LNQNGARAQSKGSTGSVATQREFLDQYCVSCHNQKAQTAGLMLDTMDLSRISENAERWEKVVRKVRAGMMPPFGVRRPDSAAMNGFSVWLEGELDRLAATRSNPGAPVLHRLNRTEYANAIHDLLNLDVDVSSLLPADESSYGFDNIASS